MQRHPRDYFGVLLIVLLVMLAGRGGAASAAVRGPRQAYAEADLIQGEYRQDLAAAQAEADRLLRQASAEERAWAELYAARVARLRGEYSEAARHSSAALRAPDKQLQAYAMIEQRWAEFESLQAPWSALNPIAPDRLCDRPGMTLEGIAFVLQVQELLKDPGRPGRVLWGEPNQLLQLEQTLETISVGADMATGRRTFPNEKKELFAGVAQQMKDQLLVFDKIGKRSSLLQPRLPALIQRVLAPVLLRLDVPEPVHEQFPCTGPARADDPHFALHCAERLLFPGGMPEDLGHSVRAALTTSSLGTHTLNGESWGDSVIWWRIKRDGRGLDWLQAAEQGFSAQQNTRGRARVALVRGADLLAGELSELKTQRRPTLPSIESLKAAIALASSQGDRGLLSQAYALRAIGHAVCLDRMQAKEAVDSLQTALSGSMVRRAGFAELFDSVGRSLAYERHDPSAYERLAALSLALYSDSPIEASYAAMQRAEQLALAGMSRQAVEVLRAGWEQLHSEACTSGPGLHCTPQPRSCALPGFVPAMAYSAALTIAASLVNLAFELQDEVLLSTWAALGKREYEHAQALIPEEPAANQQAGPAKQSMAEQLNACLKEERTDPGQAAAGKRRAECALQVYAPEVRRFGQQQLSSLAASFTGSFDQQNFLRSLIADRRALTKNPDLARSLRFAHARGAARQLPASERTTSAMLIDMMSDRASAAKRRWPSAKMELDRAARLRSRATVRVSPHLAAQGRAFVSLRRGMLAMKVGDYADSGRQLAKLRALFNSPSWYLELPNPADGVSIAIGTASGLGHHAEALRLADEAIALWEDRRQTVADLRVRGALYSQSALRGLFDVAMDAAGRAGDVDRVFRFIERAKARALQEHLLRDEHQGQSTERLLLTERALAAMSIELQHCGTSPDSLCTDRKRKYMRLEQQFDLQQQEAQQVPAAPPAPSLTQVQDRLPPGTVLLDYYLSEKYLHIVLLERDHKAQLAQVSIPNHAELRGRVERLQKHMGLAHPEAEVGRDVRILSELLFGAPPVRRVLSRPEVSELALAPHAMLHSVPYAMLRFAGRPLVSRFTLRLLPFGSTPRRKEGAGEPADAALLFHAGDSLVSSDSREALSRDRSDIEALRKLYGGKSSIELNATRKDLLEALHERQMVYLIAHGQAGPEHTQSAVLDLKGERCELKAACDDGDLRVADLYAAEQEFRAKLVYVDACVAGVGNGAVGDENVGIPRAMIQKGVGAVIAPLWAIDDEPAQRIALRYHDKYRSGKNSAAKVLAEVQREEIKEGRPVHHWAGYVTFGWE